MAEFCLSDLEQIARDALGDASIKLRADASASSVPGWDSLQHTLIVLEINRRAGISLEPSEAADAKTFGALIDLVNSRR